MRFTFMQPKKLTIPQEIEELQKQREQVVMVMQSASDVNLPHLRAKLHQIDQEIEDLQEVNKLHNHGSYQRG